jgi:putative intracellular protease/amidase
LDIVVPQAKKEYVGKRGVPFMSEFSPGDVSLDDYDAVIIPGGQAPDSMRIHPDVAPATRIKFSSFFEETWEFISDNLFC